MMKKSVIAIDGPAGAGKSTIAKMAAKKLNYIYIDTGAMYRGVAWLVLQKYQVPINTAQVLSVIEDINIRLAYDDNGNMLIFVNEQDVSTEIRTPEVTALVSQVAAISEVRQKMVELQRKMAQDGSVLMDGRDIGTCVLPNADLKIYLTASADERANRRAKEMREKGYDVDVEEIKAYCQKEVETLWDEADMQREVSPLKKADDAILLDTTKMTIDEVLQEIIRLANA
jgi:cytidylate kinase